MSPVLIGSLGIGLLLLAYALNLAGVLSQLDRSYLVVNIVGSVMAGWYAWEGANYPFVVLEAVWVLVSVVQLVNSSKKKGPSQMAKALE